MQTDIPTDELAQIMAKAISQNAAEMSHMMLIIVSALMKASGTSWRKLSAEIDAADWSYSPTTEQCGALYKDYFRSISKNEPPFHNYLN